MQQACNNATSGSGRFREPFAEKWFSGLSILRRRSLMQQIYLMQQTLMQHSIEASDATGK
jgi:hypothetical protein